MAFVGRTDVKDPGAQQDQWERVTRRRERLYAEDEQFRITRPDDQIAAAARAPGLRIAEVMATVFQGYTDRPALGQRVSRNRHRSRHRAINTAFLAALRDHQLRGSMVARSIRGRRLALSRHASGAHRGLRVCTGIRQHRLHSHRMRLYSPRCGRGTPADQRAGQPTRTDPDRDAAPNLRGGYRQSRDCRRGSLSGQLDRHRAAATHRLRLRAP